MTSKFNLSHVPPAVLRPSQAATYLGISRSAFYDLTKCSEIQLIKLGARAAGVLRADLDAWLAERRASVVC